MRLIRGTPVHQNNRRAPINHAIFPNLGTAGAGRDRVTNARAGRAGASAIAAQEQALEETGASLRREAEEGASRLGVPLTFVIARGDPYTELKRVADEMRADAVIVGASMQAGHRWIGSLAVRLVKAGRWPVTVVP